MSTIRIELIKQVEKNDPNFKAVLTYAGDVIPPFRAYLHGAGIEAFSKDPLPEIAAKDHLFDVLHSNSHLLEGVDFMIAALWGNEGKKIVDLFRYADVVSDWNDNPGNPDFLEPLVFKNGFYIPSARVRTCEDSIIVLGAEGKHRRKSRDMEQYMALSPDIEGIVDAHHK